MVWLVWFQCGKRFGSRRTCGSRIYDDAIPLQPVHMLSWMVIDMIRDGKPTVVGACTGAVLGLVAITPGAGFVPLWSAIYYRHRSQSDLLFYDVCSQEALWL